MANRPDSAGNWEPKTPKPGTGKQLEPGARERSDVVSGTNELKEFVGGAGAQKDPLGKKGREF